MKTARALVTAVVAWAVITTALSLITLDLPAEVLQSADGRLQWFAYPQAGTTFAMVVLAALAYWRRRVPLRASFVVAVLAVPVLHLVVITALGAFSGGGPVLVGVRFAAGLVGGAAGWLLVHRFGPRRQR